MDPFNPPVNLHQQAIKAALNSDWQEALKLNQLIIDTDPQNVDALNRQARAYFELGKLSLAKKFYSETLRYDPYNPIATKNLKIIKTFKKDHADGNNHKQHYNGRTEQILASMFLQEPGKTKIVNLIKVAEPQKLSRCFCGMEVEMSIKNRKLTVFDPEGGYLGVIPDDISYKLMRLVKGGNKYQVFVKSIRFNGLSVLIRETLRSKKFKNQPSFLDYRPMTQTADIIPALKNDGEDDNASENDGEEETEI